MSSYRITETKQPTIQQVTEYITDDNWMSFLTRHMDVIDEKKHLKINQIILLHLQTLFVGHSIYLLRKIF
jgi:hypothetical protein